MRLASRPAGGRPASAHSVPLRPLAGIAVTLLPLLYPALVSAADGTELKEVVVSATLTEQDSRTAPASVTIISREELETRNATDLLEAVRGAPGITFSPRQVSGRKTVALRGLEGKHTLTLIDGRRISPSDDVVGHSDYQYGWLPMSAVERIEIIRGPMSTLYGSEALGGVINLITRQPKDRWIGSVSISGSEVQGDEGGGGHNASVFASGPIGERLTLRVTGEKARNGAIAKKEDRRSSEIEGRESDSVGIGATFQLTPQHSLEANWNEVREQRFYDDVSITRTPVYKETPYRNSYSIQRNQGNLTWKGKFADWKTQVRAYQSEIDIQNSRTNGVSATRPQNMQDRVIDGFGTIKLGSHMLTLGGELREETLRNNGLTNGKDDATHKALFVQDELPLGHQLTLTGGVRVDHHEYFGSETSPRLYLVWEASPEWVIKGGYGHAFKAPTLKQISPSYVGAEGPHTFQGNANIKPEKSDSFEISADWRKGSMGAWATLFNTEVEDLITYKLLSVSGGRRSYLYDNVDKARIRGIEGGFSWDFAKSWSWNNSLTLLDTKDKSTGKKLEDRPDQTLTSRVDWKGGDGWSVRAGLEYTGKQTTAGLPLPAYTLWNGSVGKQLGKGFSLRVGINNLTDVRLAEKSPNFGYAETGRTIFATLRSDF
ncbi:TonB-dependent receptor plug domain-containing protein [Azospira sp. I09]|jgi:outer membrane receptor for ferrienterochelin and colicins|uniref:TonB-dependent receptor plug domain-containing protein n=1 Tax=Azospira sp. I09 TaxID=1765049 RepID=UPI001260C5A2|nr:TonB-dependent receptor [Azospira sp. I09]BBN90315.1 TonB-dependent receptor [Azospira sp. I09]